MSRRTSNFIQTFVDTYKDNYVPTKFYFWGAISTVAAALERKVWIPFGKDNIYPHMFITLVSAPGIGKSSAMRRGRRLLQKMTVDYGKKIRLLPNKVTEPKMLDIMGTHDYFTYRNQHYKHTSLYLISSEGATGTKDLYGGFTDTLTALYDGDDLSKATVSRSKEVKVINPCINYIGGYTFSSLNDLLTHEGIMGGFASRIIYVIQQDKLKRTLTWQEDTRGEGAENVDSDLVHDLAKINEMVGPFKGSPEYAKTFNDWFIEHDEATQCLENEKLRALMVRKPDMVRKLSMIFSASRDDSRILSISDWENSLKLVEDNEKSLPSMIRKGQAMLTNSQEGLVNAIMQEVVKASKIITRRDIVSRLVTKGFRGRDVMETATHLISGNGPLKEINGGLVLVDNPDLYI